MRLIQSSIIIVSLTLLATCFAKNEASVRGLKKAKGSKLPTKSVKSFKSSKKAKAAKSDKTKTGKKSKTPKGKKGGSGSKSAKSTKKSSKNFKIEGCNFEKSSKAFNRVIEEYDAYEDIRLKFPGIPSFLDPVVTTTIAMTGDFVSICLEDAVVECSRRCAEQDGKCTLFEVGDIYDSRGYHCYMINNKMNEFNPRRIYSDLSPTNRHVYSKKSAPRLIEDVMPKGLYPENFDSADFQTHGLPGVFCVGTQAGTQDFDLATFEKCSACVLPQTVIYSGCINLVAGICGSVSPDSGFVPNFFSDFNCGEECFSGYRSNYACLSKLQTYVLAIQGQARFDHPEYGESFGCTMSNIFDPTTGEQLPDYTCPPNTNQPTPN